jgi:integrase
MPWKLVPPRPGKTQFYYIRGKYCGIALDDSTGTAEKRAAARILKTQREQAERGEHPKQQAEAPDRPTFLSATVAYLQSGGDGTFVAALLDRWRHRYLDTIDQVAIDTLAGEVYPDASMATRNRQVYTPVSAILKGAGIERPIKRPQGWRGKKSTSWLEKEQAFALFCAADEIDAEFGLLCRFLCYTGMRLSEALSVTIADLKIDRAYVYLPDSKTGEPRGCHLPPVVVDALQAQPPRPARTVMQKGQFGFRKGDGGRQPADAGIPFLERGRDQKLFRFHKGGALYGMLSDAMHAAKLSFPRRQRGFHIFCHTYGSWMHRYGGLDTFGLTRTRRWADPSSADRYVHTDASEEARRADRLPAPERGQIVEIKKQTG